MGFQRDHIAAGTSREVSLSIDLRSLSSVNGKGIRSILPGKYTLSLGGAQPQETTAKSEAGFTVTGLLELTELPHSCGRIMHIVCIVNIIIRLSAGRPLRVAQRACGRVKFIYFHRNALGVRLISQSCWPVD